MSVKRYLSGGVAELICPRALGGVTRTRFSDWAQPHFGGQFKWVAGSEHADHHHPGELTCFCGEALVFVSGTDPWAHPYIVDEGREPHDPTYHNPEP